MCFISLCQLLEYIYFSWNVNVLTFESDSVYWFHLYHKSFKMAEEKAKKPLHKKWRFRVIVFIFVCWILNSLAKDWNTTTSSVQAPAQQTEEKTDVVQERINRINELYAEESSFDKVEVIWNNSIAIVFKELPDLWIEDEIDSITRWQAMNLSKEVNGVASVKTYIWWEAQMFCTATRWTVNDCSDYR